MHVVWVQGGHSASAQVGQDYSSVHRLHNNRLKASNYHPYIASWLATERERFSCTQTELSFICLPVD